jgi:putative ABC transport system permease protein
MACLYERRRGETAMLNDLRLAVRQLAKSPGFSAVAVLTLTLGMGANTVVFSAIHSVLLQPLPFPDSGRLMTIWSWNTRFDSPRYGSSGPDYLDWREHNRCFEQLAAFSWPQITVIGARESQQVDGLAVTANYFDVFRTPPQLGRTFTEEEATAANRRYAVISDAYWRSRFGADPGVVGRVLTLDSGPSTVVGVASPEMAFRQEPRPQVYVPLDLAHEAQRRNFRFLWIVGRLKPHVTKEQALADLRALSQRLATVHPDTNRNWDVNLLGLQELLTQNVRRPLLLLYVGAAALLLICCVNCATLLLVRSASRQQEIAIRSAVGAGRGRLIRQLLTESLVLACAGGIGGAIAAVWGVGATRALVRQIADGGGIAGTASVQINLPVLAFAFLMILGAVVAFGAYPALRLSRTAVAPGMRDADKTSTGRPSRQRLLSSLVVAEIALTCLLLVGGGLLTRSLLRLKRADPGFRPTGLLSVELNRPNRGSTQTDTSRARFSTSAIERVASLPGVVAVASTSATPFSGNAFSQGFELENRPAPEGVQLSGELRAVSPSYFGVMGIPLRRGRALERTDDGGHLVVVIDEVFAHRFLAAEDPIGQRLRISGRSHEVVGVVGGVKVEGLGDTAYRPHFYVPITQLCPENITLIVRTEREPTNLAAAVRQAIAEVDPHQPVRRTTAMQRIAERTIAPQRLSAALVSSLALLALGLSALGTYGVVAFVVARRARELAIRMALGARGAEVFRSVLARGAILVGLGLGIGLLGALMLRHLVSSFLYEVVPSDPVSFVLAAVLLSSAAVLACWIPARRAAKVDPIVALRCE